MKPALLSWATSQKVIPAFGKRSEIGMKAEPMMPNTCSIPCRCSTFTKASSVVILMSIRSRFFQCCTVAMPCRRATDPLPGGGRGVSPSPSRGSTTIRGRRMNISMAKPIAPMMMMPITTTSV